MKERCMSSRPVMSLLKQKRYRRCLLLVLIPLLSPYLFHEMIDRKFGLCSVRCRGKFGKTSVPSLDFGVEGNRPMFAPDRCDCYQRTNTWISTFLGSISWHETNPPPSHLSDQVCGADGRVYDSQKSACSNETYPLHGGSCGACSNEHDINVYRETRQTMSLLAYKCSIMYVFFGNEKSAFDCFKSADLTNQCNQCWVDNMKCSASSCLGKCIWHNMINKMPWSDKSVLNECIKCDEEKCGPAFIQCAGANRRRAGVVSDIDRPQTQVWNRTIC